MQRHLKKWSSDLDGSVGCEKAADGHRERGQYSSAMKSYIDALVAEKRCKGSQATLAYLWRKIVLVGGRKSIHVVDGLSVDWISADKIGTTVDGLCEPVLPFLQLGDCCFKKGEYTKAMKEYQQAAMTPGFNLR